VPAGCCPERRAAGAVVRGVTRCLGALGGADDEGEGLESWVDPVTRETGDRCVGVGGGANSLQFCDSLVSHVKNSCVSSFVIDLAQMNRVPFVELGL